MRSQRWQRLGQPVKLSACLIVKNEAAMLGPCLASLVGVADEVIVVDTGSTDDTVKIALESGAKVSHLPWPRDFAAARNASLEQATGDWILVLDADERLTPDAGRHIRHLMQFGGICFELRFLNYLNDTGEGEAMEHYLTRLFPNRPHIRYQGVIHEQLVSLDPAQPLNRKGFSELMILHEGYRPGVVEAQGKQERNRDLLLQAVATEPANPFHRFNLALNHQNGGEPEQALAEFQACLALAEPDAGFIVPAWVQVIGLTAELGDLDQALALAEQAPPSCEANPDYWNTFANVLLAAGHARHAILAFEKAAEFTWRGVEGFTRYDRASMTWKPYHGIAQAHLLLGDFGSMAVYLHQALAESPDNPLSAQQLREIERALPWLG